MPFGSITTYGAWTELFLSYECHHILTLRFWSPASQSSFLGPRSAPHPWLILVTRVRFLRYETARCFDLISRHGHRRHQGLFRAFLPRYSQKLRLAVLRSDSAYLSSPRHAAIPSCTRPPLHILLRRAPWYRDAPGIEILQDVDPEDIL